MVSVDVKPKVSKRRSVRRVLHDHRQQACVDKMLEVLKWSTLQSRGRKSRLVTFYKYQHGLLSINTRIPDNFQQDQKEHQTNPYSAPMTTPPAEPHTARYCSFPEPLQTGTACQRRFGCDCTRPRGVPVTSSVNPFLFLLLCNSNY